MAYLSNSTIDPMNLGWFATEAALNAAFPVGADGYFAIVGDTNTVWTWDSGTSAWVNTNASGGTSVHNNLTGLQGGTTDEYFHFTSARHSMLAGIADLTPGTEGKMITSDGLGSYQISTISAVKSYLSLNNVENTAISTWIGSSNIVTVGTIGTGIWQGTAIADGYIASAATWNAKQDALTFGIADTNAVDIDSADVASGEYSKFTANGLESKSFAEVKTDLSLNNVENTAISTWIGTSNITTLGTIGTGTWQGTAITDTYIASAATWNAKQDTLTFGIADTNAVDIDSASVASGEYAKFTANGLESKTFAEVKTDLSLNNVENTAISTFAGSSNIVTVGTLSAGNATAVVDASSKTVAGKVELATTAEIDTGTDSTRAMPVDQFVASKRNIRWLVFNLVKAGTDCAVATNIGGDFVSPIAGTILQSDSTPFYLYATNSTAGATGTMVVDVSLNGTSIMTTNKLDFDTGEKTTTTASTPPDLTDTTIAVGDILTVDVDSLHTTAAKGLTLYMAIRE